jgi:hypothetical protein
MLGCYTKFHVSVLQLQVRIGAPSVVYWAGTDSMNLLMDGNKDVVQFFRDNTELVHHIAASHWISDDLRTAEIPHIQLPVSLVEVKQNPCRLGESIYMYKADSVIYNGGIYEEIKRRVPYNFIETNVHTFTKEQLIEAYKKCFIGLRFTEHDGLSETVAEMGLMGRKVIHNGDLPNCIHYDKNNIDGIVEAIHKEHRQIEHPDFWASPYDTMRAVQRYLEVGDDFLNTEYYDKRDSCVTSLELR